MKVVTFFVLAMLILTPLSYFILLGINNAVWWFKGLEIDNDTPEYARRKIVLKIISVPTALAILYLL